MQTETIHRHLIQLLKHGYTEQEIRSLVIAPHQIIDQAVAEYRQQQRITDRQQKSQQDQASYAMGLKH